MSLWLVRIKPILSTHQTCLHASCLDSVPSTAMASRIRSAMAIPAVPAPKITTRKVSMGVSLVEWIAAYIAAKATQAVPCTLSLKHAN